MEAGPVASGRTVAPPTPSVRECTKFPKGDEIAACKAAAKARLANAATAKFEGELGWRLSVDNDCVRTWTSTVETTNKGAALPTTLKFACAWDPRTEKFEVSYP